MNITSAITISLMLFACGGTNNQPAAPRPATAEPQAHAHGGAGMAGMCPMELPETKVSAEDTNDGVAIAFTTTGDVASLRQRVHHMAEMHESMHEPMMKMVPSTARAEDIGGGARLVLTPKDPAQLAELRAHVHEHASQMASGHCPMMQHHG